MKANQSPVIPQQHSRHPAAEPDRTAQVASETFFVDNRPEATAQRKLSEVIKNSPQQAAQRRFINGVHNSPHMIAQRQIKTGIRNSHRMAAQHQQLHGMSGNTVQMQGELEEQALQMTAMPTLLPQVPEMVQGQSKFNQPEGGSVPLPLRGRSSNLNLLVQRQDDEEKELIQEQFSAAQRVEKEEPLHGKFVHQSPAQLGQQPAAKPNDTGLPDNLKSGIESLSGMSMDTVKVHYNSSQPAQLNALAYAQGTDIHVAPGQEQHLPHEAWHVVQQAQGRVKPTMQMKEGVTVNDDPVLEQEADMMGAIAVTSNSSTGFSYFPVKSAIQATRPSSLSISTIQAMFIDKGKFNWINTETGNKYKQVEIRVDNRVRLQISNESAAPFYVYWIDGEWQTKEQIYSDALELGYEVGLQVKNEQDKENYIKLCFTGFSKALKGDKTIGLESLEQQYRLGVRDGIAEIAKDYQVNKLENPEEGYKIHNKSVRKTELKENVSKVLIDAQNDIFIPEISYRDEEVEDEDDYDPLTWQASQEEENLKVAGAVDQHVSSEANEKVVEILFHVIKAGISSDRAIYAPKEWTNDVLPNLPAENKKAIAADVFSTWMSGKAYRSEDVPLLNRKLQSLEIQYGLTKSSLTLEDENKHLYAELKASPSLFVPILTANISGSTGVATGGDKLDAVQYDGPELSPLGQFLESFNKSYAKEAFALNGGGKIPAISKGDTKLNTSGDTTTKKYYRPGTVEAISTTPRGKGRSGSGETQIGRMGVQEEMFNTGVLKSGQYEGGHLIGDQIMDPKKFNLYESWNLAPQENEFNAPIYESGVEAGATEAVKGGGEVHIKASVSYPADTYKLPVLDLVDRAMDGKNKDVIAGVTWHDAVEDVQKNKTTLPTDFSFMTRVPGYWHINAKDVKKSNKMKGSITQRTEGVQVLTAISASSVYAPSSPERYKFAIFTGGDSTTGKALDLPVKPKSKPKSKYQKENEVSLYARQKTSVSGTSATDIRTMSVSQINAVIKNSTTASNIKTWLVSNPNDHTITNLANVKGVGPVMLSRIKAAGWTM